MENVRRAYVYLVCLASLQGVAWAVISLLRNLLAPPARTSPENTALQLAIIIVALPVFVVHWVWAQRLAAGDEEERGAILRRLYLYVALATFLGPLLANALDLLDDLLHLALGLRPESARFVGEAPLTYLAHPLVVMGVMLVLWLYHRAVLRRDQRQVAEESAGATLRRLYLYGWSAAGLALVALSLIALLRWLLEWVGAGAVIVSQPDPLREVARLAVGLPLWLICWGQAQRLFAGADEGERASVERQGYLYLVILASVLAAVGSLTTILANILGRLLGAPDAGISDLRPTLAILPVAALVWAYHAYVLRHDIALAGEPSGAAWLRQTYRYLVAAIGLGALLVGVAGDLTLLIRALAGAQFVGGVSGQAAWFTALILTGLPVWMLPWRSAQLAATAPGPEGDQESQSPARKIYLYFYLLIATATVLGSGVYVVSRLLALALGASQEGNLLAEVAQAVVYSGMAVGIWLYHGALLRADGRRAKQMRAEALAELRVAILAPGDEALQSALLEGLRRELPGLDLSALDAAAADAPRLLAQADLIVGPWPMALELAVAASPAQKLLLPAERPGWHWLGQRELRSREAVRAAVRAIRQLAAGQQPETPRHPNMVVIVLAVILGLGLLSCIAPMFIAMIGGL
jgi:hypothetical protein